MPTRKKTQGKKVLVTGGPSFNNKELLERVLKQEAPSVIIAGGLEGPETMATEYGRKHGIRRMSFPMPTPKYTRASAFERNSFMFETAKPDVVIAFPGGIDTHEVVKMARNTNCAVRIVEAPKDTR